MVYGHGTDDGKNQTPGLRDRQGTIQSEPDPGSLGESGGKGTANENQSKRINREIDSLGELSTADEASNLGGILRQLRELQTAHLAYVKAHEDRLRSRLDENIGHQRRMTDSMAQLESAVIAFMEKEASKATDSGEVELEQSEDKGE